MVVRGTRSSLARARMIRSARRGRSSKLFSKRSASSSSESRTSSTSKTSTNSQAKKISQYEAVQKAANELEMTAKTLVELGTVKTESSITATETNQTTSTELNNTINEAETQTKEKTQVEQKNEIIAAVKDMVNHYNTIYKELEEIGGSVNTIFLSQMKKIIQNSEDDLKKTGVTLNRDGTLLVTSKTLENADLSSLKEIYCKSSGIVGKLKEKCEYIGNNAASTINVMNRMYGTQTYNKYGSGNSYYGSSGSRYNATT